MKKFFKGSIPIFCIGIVILLAAVLSGFGFKSRVTANLDAMLADPAMGIYSHTIFYKQRYPQLYNEILDLGEDALGDLMKDFAAHPDDNLRRQLIADLVGDIVQRDGLDFDMAALSGDASGSDSEIGAGQQSSNPRRTVLRGAEFVFREGAYVPEPEGVSPPEGVKWDTRLGCYIRDNIYYDEVNQYYYRMD